MKKIRLALLEFLEASGKIAHAAASILAPNTIALFFRNENSRLISTRGKEVLNDPEMMQKVQEQIKQHEENGTSGPVVVNLQ